MYMNIEIERLRTRMSKEKLSNELGITSKTYRNWVDGITPIPSTALLNMSSLWNVNISYLLEDVKVS